MIINSLATLSRGDKGDGRNERKRTEQESVGGGVERGYGTLISVMLGSAEHKRDSAMAGLV